MATAATEAERTRVAEVAAFETDPLGLHLGAARVRLLAAYQPDLAFVPEPCCGRRRVGR